MSRAWLVLVWGLAVTGCIQDVKLQEQPDVVVEDSDPIDTDVAGTPLLQVDPLLVDFGYVPEGDAADADVTLTNVGDGDLELSGVSITGDAFSSPDDGTTLVVPPGGSLRLRVDFLSTAGDEQGALELLTNDASLGALTIPLEGTGADPQATAPALDLGFVRVDTTATAPWPVDNPGNQPVTVTAVRSDDPAFEVTLSGPVTIAPGGSAALEVRFTPRDVVPYAGQLTLDTDARVAPAPIPVAGHGADAPAVVCEAVPPLVTVDTQSFTLVGAGSADPIGRPLTFAWSLVSAPAGSGLALPPPGAPDVGPLIADEVGAYTAELVVTNDLGLAAPPCRVTVTARAAPPDAVCAVVPDTVAATRDAFGLVGSGSTDPDGRPLTATWTVTSRPRGSAFTLPASGALDRPGLVVDQPGDYTFALVVTNDRGAASDPCEVTLHATGLSPIATCEASPPVLIAGRDSTFLIGAGSSDPLGRPLVSGTWTLVSAPRGSTLTLPPGTALDRGPIRPDRPGSFVFSLVVTNDLGLSSAPCEVTVDARPPEPIAVCDATPRSLDAGRDTFTLLGAGSYDPAGRPLTAAWRLVAAPAGSATTVPGGAALDRGPIAPDLPGRYTAELVVTNDLGVASQPCQVSIDARGQPPVAWCAADPPRVTATVEGFRLIGSASFDPLGLPIVAARWTMLSQPAGSTVTLPGGTQPDRGPIVPDLPGDYVARLVVTNSQGLDSTPCDVTVVATAPPPVAVCSASPTSVVAGSGAFTLVGDRSYDPLGAPITSARWTFTRQPAGSTVVMPGGQQPNRGPITPDLPGTWEAQLVVTNALGVASAPCTVTVTATATDPVAVCEALPRTVTALHESFSWVGSGSYDPGGGTITRHTWTLRSRPVGSTLTMPGGTSAVRGPLTPDVVGDYEAELVVTSSTGRTSAPCVATLTAEADGDLWIELSWTVAEDIDLHLIRGGGARNSSDDCYYANCRGAGLPWGGPSTIDDPVLDRDDTTGTGPENINITRPVPDLYRVTVHDFPGSFSGVNTFTVKVYLGGVLELMDTRQVSGEGTWTDVADIDLRGAIPVITPL